MNHILRYLLCLLLFGSSYAAVAMRDSIVRGRWCIEADYMTGNILRHSKKLKIVPTDWTQGVELSFMYRTTGGRGWHRPLNYPEVGGVFEYFHIGANAILGDAFALMAVSKFYLGRTKVVDFYTRIGGGVGFMTRHYDYQTNPLDNYVGNTVNMAVQIRLGMDWHITPYAQIVTAFSFNHFSDAAIRLPNYGMNLALATIGIRAVPMPMRIVYNRTRPIDFFRNEINVRYTLGIQEIYAISGPKYPIHEGSVAYARYTSPGNKIYVGIAVEYLRSMHDYIVYNEIKTRYTPTAESTIASVVLGDELLLGRVGMFYSAGVYLWNNRAAITPFYFKVGANVYLAQLVGKRLQLFMGTNVKSHTSVAQSWDFSGGAAWRMK